MTTEVIKKGMRQCFNLVGTIFFLFFFIVFSFKCSNYISKSRKDWTLVWSLDIWLTWRHELLYRFLLIYLIASQTTDNNVAMESWGLRQVQFIGEIHIFGIEVAAISCRIWILINFTIASSAYIVSILHYIL